MENKQDIKYIQILPAPTEGATKILELVKFTQCKTLRTLKIDVFEIPHNKSIGKLFSKLDNTFNNDSIFNAKYTDFSTKQKELLHFQSPIW